MKIYDRATGTYAEETEYQQSLLRFLYQTLPGRILLKLAVSPAFSRWRARYPRSPRSRKDIKPFAEQYGVTISDEDLSAFKIPLNEAVEMVMSGRICDSKTQTLILMVNNLINKGELK